MKPLFDVLTDMGAKISYLENEGFLPIRIEGIGNRISLNEMYNVKLDISKSTQFLSALLLISPMLKQGMNIEITSERKDGSYIRITRKMMEQFGVNVSFDGVNYTLDKNSSYKAGVYQIEPDVSAACYFYAAAAITGGRVVVKNVTWECMQGDLKFIKLLGDIGCKVTDTPKGIEVIGAKDGKIDGITVDMKDFSDQAITLAAIAPFAKSDVRIENIGHIRLQESDRIHAIATELNNLGVSCCEEESAVTIHPSLPHGGLVHTYDDHRMAMGFSLIGLRVEGIEIDDYKCCRKTFEEYFDVLDKLTKL
jgi:3-phosphoshikimate 1-carboxyvinyltransferase